MNNTSASLCWLNKIVLLLGDTRIWGQGLWLSDDSQNDIWQMWMQELSLLLLQLEHNRDIHLRVENMCIIF